MTKIFFRVPALSRVGEAPGGSHRCYYIRCEGAAGGSTSVALPILPRLTVAWHSGAALVERCSCPCGDIGRLNSLSTSGGSCPFCDIGRLFVLSTNGGFVPLVLMLILLSIVFVCFLFG